MSAFSPNFRAYAAAHGRTPEAQLAHDEAAWPGGIMTGFMLWIAERKRAFKAEHPECFLFGDIWDYDVWLVWLQESPAVTTETPCA